MTELQTPTIDINETSNDFTEEAFDAFESQLVGLADLVPDVEQLEGLEQEARSIISEFALQPSLFESPDRSLVFCGIVGKSINAQAEQSNESTLASRELIADMLTVLAHDHSAILKNAFSHDDVHSHELDEQNNVLAYDAYTDRALTEELVSAIQTNGLLDEVKQRLGIDEDNEDPYEIRVLSVAHTDMPVHGLAEDRSELDAEFSMDLLDQVNIERKDIADWKDGLLKRGSEFAKRLGRTELSADAWVTVLDGKTTLCLASPFAEKLIDPEITNNTSYYSEGDRARDIAVLEHEYTHTQGGASVDHDIIGINMEELRAEMFSGNRLGYQDMKSFFSDYTMFTGHDIRGELLSKPKGGANIELYASIANNVGIDAMVDVLYALPNSYMESEQASTFLRNITKSTGGYDGVLSRVLEKQMKSGDGKVQDRIADAAKRVAEILNKPNSTLDIDAFVALRKRHGVSVGAELIHEYMSTHYPKAG